MFEGILEQVAARRPLVHCITNYVTIMLITNGGPGVQTEVWALSAYHKAFSDSQYGYGAAISLVLIVVVMVLMLVIGAVMHHQEKSRS